MNDMVLKRGSKVNKKKQIVVIAMWIGIVVFACWYFQELKYNIITADDAILYNVAWREGNTFAQAMNVLAQIRIRPLYYPLMYFIIPGLGANLEMYFYMNLAILLATSFLLWLFVCKATNKQSFAFIVAILMLFSRFNWYAISQVHGSMEGLAMLFTVAFMLCLQKFIAKPNLKSIAFAALWVLCAMFTHERYFILVVPLALVILFAKCESIKTKLKCLLIAMLPIVAELVCLAIAGYDVIARAGTDAGALTFDMGLLGSFVADGLINIFVGPKGQPYLAGLDIFVGNPFPAVLTVAVVAFVCYIALIVVWIICICKEERAMRGVRIKNMAVWVTLFVSILGVSCVTQRLEMRWLYTPYVVMLAISAWMIKDSIQICEKSKCKRKKWKTVTVYVLFSVFALGSLIVNFHAYQYKGNDMFFIRWQENAKKVYEETVEKYNEEIANGETYVVGELGSEMQSVMKIYFVQEHPEYNMENFRCVEHIEDIKNIEQDTLVFVYDDNHDIREVSNELQ